MDDMQGEVVMILLADGWHSVHGYNVDDELGEELFGCFELGMDPTMGNYGKEKYFLEGPVASVLAKRCTIIPIPVGRV